MNSVVRVLIGDDHRIVREGLKQVLGDPANGAPEITVVAEATQGSEVLEQVTALQGRTGAPGLDLVLLDIAMPGMDGLEVLQALRKAWPALPVLMLSTYPERQYAVRAAQQGAPAGVDALSYREHQVFRLLTAGQSVSEIGAQLKLAPNTVSTYRARILEKTGARNDVELALLARGAPAE